MAERRKRLDAAGIAQAVALVSQSTDDAVKTTVVALAVIGL